MFSGWWAVCTNQSFNGLAEMFLVGGVLHCKSSAVSLGGGCFKKALNWYSNLGLSRNDAVNVYKEVPWVWLSDIIRVMINGHFSVESSFFVWSVITNRFISVKESLKPRRNIILVNVVSLDFLTQLLYWRLIVWPHFDVNVGLSYSFNRVKQSGDLLFG